MKKYSDYKNEFDVVVETTTNGTNVEINDDSVKVISVDFDKVTNLNECPLCEGRLTDQCECFECEIAWMD